MLCSRRPTGLTFCASTALVTFFAVVFLYHIWNYDDRPASKAAQIALHEAAQPPPYHHTSIPPASQAAQLPPPNSIPKKLWYKLGPNGLNNETKEWTNSCIESNPNYKHEFMDDKSSDWFVQKAFEHRPDLVDTYLNLSIPILKADLLRYLLLFDKGGIWSDLDVACEGVPIDEWIPQKYKNNAGLVVGWEFDVGWGDNFIRQFTSWTIMAKPRLAHMAMVIDDILDGLKEKTEKNKVSLGELTLDMVGDVVDITGPRRLTDSVLKSLEKMLGEKIMIRDISNLVEPKLVGDVLIMPGYSFAASSNNYGGRDLGGVQTAPPGAVLITHHYAGTWKNDHGGEQPQKI
jgi:alpha 1,6-mannosyltransferase